MVATEYKYGYESEHNVHRSNHTNCDLGVASGTLLRPKRTVCSKGYDSSNQRPAIAHRQRKAYVLKRKQILNRESNDATSDATLFENRAC